MDAHTSPWSSTRRSDAASGRPLLSCCSDQTMPGMSRKSPCTTVAGTASAESSSTSSVGVLSVEGGGRWLLRRLPTLHPQVGLATVDAVVK